MENLKLAKPAGPLQWLRIYRLYRSAFPAAERKPFGVIVRMYRQGRADVWYLTRSGRFVGFASTVNSPALVLLDYFAVEKRQRGRGIGTAAMARMQECYAHRGLFVEIESTREAASNRQQRLRRKQFYLAAGMAELHTRARVFGVSMELLGSRCTLDLEGYRRFYRDHYSAWAAEHIEDPDR